ncbi:CsbD family protein [Terriglobus sp. TAA 43]|uniref:CsbD family protein n=1 Tax=Terriglobus sp. TAA 43 TaxID=278961 RepID=UPI000648D258|nr:CsbD family protein [Terriglobus sp. TAA 43]
MNSDQIKGKMQNAFGKAEQAVGEAVNSRDLANAGAEDRVKGAAKETWGNAKDTVHEMHKTAKTHADIVTGEPVTARDKFAAGVEHIKDSVNTKMDEMKTREQIKRDELRRSA